MAGPVVSFVTVGRDVVSMLNLLRATQDAGRNTCEHIVVASETDERTEWLCNEYGARYIPIAPNASYKDARGVGTYAARGKYVTWWDDNFLPEQDAAVALCARAAKAKHDLLVLQTRVISVDHKHIRDTLDTDVGGLPLPTDTYACAILAKRSVAVEEDWRRVEGDRHDIYDHNWLQRVVNDGATFIRDNYLVGTIVL